MPFIMNRATMNEDDVVAHLTLQGWTLHIRAIHHPELGTMFMSSTLTGRGMGSVSYRSPIDLNAFSVVLTRECTWQEMEGLFCPIAKEFCRRDWTLY